MRLALLALPLLLWGCAPADPLARCTAPATRELSRIDALVIESERAIARGHRVEPRRVRGPVVGFCSRRDNFGACLATDLTPPPRLIPVDRAAERARLETLRARQALARESAAAIARGCAAGAA